MNATESENEPDEYLVRLAVLCQEEDAKITFIKELINESKQQRQIINELKVAVDDARNAKERSQRRYLEASTQTERETKNPYVVLLLDGDGMIFTESYLTSKSLGSKAAIDLLYHIRHLVDSLELFSTTDFDVLIRAFANVRGLTDTMRSRGLQIDFRDFAVGFSQPKPMVDYIDVGRGKEMADAKIAGEMRFHISNSNCKLVILGASHDNGYARVLTSLLADGVDHDRVVLLEGTPFAKEFKDLPFRKTKFDNMLLSTGLENWAPDTKQESNTTTSSGGIPPPHRPETTTQSTRRPLLPRPPAVLLGRVAAIKPTPCFSHYLQVPDGSGCSVEKCSHPHTIAFSDDEVWALGYLAQSRRCHKGSACARPGCFFGHKCQAAGVGVCTGQDCPFRPEEHDVGQYQPVTESPDAPCMHFIWPKEGLASCSMPWDAGIQGKSDGKPSRGQNKRHVKPNR